MDAIYTTLRDSLDEIAAITGRLRQPNCLSGNLMLPTASAAETRRWSPHRLKRQVEEPATMAA